MEFESSDGFDKYGVDDEYVLPGEAVPEPPIPEEDAEV